MLKIKDVRYLLLLSNSFLFPVHCVESLVESLELASLEDLPEGELGGSLYDPKGN